LMKRIEDLQSSQDSELASSTEQIRVLQIKLDQHAEERDSLKSQLTEIQKDLKEAWDRAKEAEADLKRLQDDTSKKNLENELAISHATSKRLEQENQLLEQRAVEAEEKVSLLLDQVENSVDTYRRSIMSKRTDGNSPPLSPRSSSIGNRTSVALDSLAHELDQLRSHWESSSHRYRLSTTSSLGRESPTSNPFNFESHRLASPSSERKLNGLRMENDSRWRDGIEVPNGRQVVA
jgi:chromosome segregation ATPase